MERQLRRERDDARAQLAKVLQAQRQYLAGNTRAVADSRALITNMEQVSTAFGNDYERVVHSRQSQQRSSTLAASISGNAPL